MLVSVRDLAVYQVSWMNSASPSKVDDEHHVPEGSFSFWGKEEIPLTIRIAQMVLRTCVVLALILGILFWTGNAADSLIPVHIGLGILVVLSLWTLGFAQALTKGGSWGLAIGAVVLGIIIAAFGGAQAEILTGSLHWVIQGIHLLLSLSALGLGERIGGRYRRRRVTAMS